MRFFSDRNFLASQLQIFSQGGVIPLSAVDHRKSDRLLAFVKHDGEKSRLVIVPDKDEIPRETLLSILDQAGLTKDKFVRLLIQ